VGGAVDDAARATHWQWKNRKQLIAGISEQLVARGKPGWDMTFSTILSQMHLSEYSDTLNKSEKE